MPGTTSGVGELTGDAVGRNGDETLGVGDGWSTLSPGASVAVAGGDMAVLDRLNRITNEPVKARVETSKEICALLIRRLLLSWLPTPEYIRPR